MTDANKSLAALGHAQRERLAYIDFRLYFLGEVRRADLLNRFGIAPAGATRDFALYRELAPANSVLDNRSKSYRIADGFRPLFAHAPARVLTTLSQGFGDGAGSEGGPLLPCEFPVPLNLPPVETLAPVTRAIHAGRPLRLRYHSHTSGTTEREIVPHALVDTGLRWHARAYDRRSQEFRDFVLTRMEAPMVLESEAVPPNERAAMDIQWTRIVELELVPHPAHTRPEVIERDYEMRDGVLRLHVRAAAAGYMLRQWCVDCSPDHRLMGEEYRLWLKDALALYGVRSAVLAPGYCAPESKH